jgi:glycosyltransferase involved in cell wall biosynthesis
MPDLVIDNETGLTFTAGDAADLANKVRWAWENPAEMSRMGLIARSRYETDYTEGPNHDRVIQIYRDAIEQRKADAHKRPQLSEAV